MSIEKRFQDMLIDVCSDILVTGQSGIQVAPGLDVTFSIIFESEMDQLTHQLERDGFRIWFDCEVDGIEYRLAARS